MASDLNPRRSQNLWNLFAFKNQLFFAQATLCVLYLCTHVWMHERRGTCTHMPILPGSGPTDGADFDRLFDWYLTEQQHKQTLKWVVKPSQPYLKPRLSWQNALCLVNHNNYHASDKKRTHVMFWAYRHKAVLLKYMYEWKWSKKLRTYGKCWKRKPVSKTTLNLTLRKSQTEEAPERAKRLSTISISCLCLMFWNKFFPLLNLQI